MSVSYTLGTGDTVEREPDQYQASWSVVGRPETMKIHIFGVLSQTGSH